MPFSFDTVYRWKAGARALGHTVVCGVYERPLAPAWGPVAASGDRRYAFRMEHAYLPGAAVVGTIIEDSEDRIVVRDSAPEDAGEPAVDHVFERLTLPRLREMIEAHPAPGFSMAAFVSDEDVQTFYSEDLIDDYWEQLRASETDGAPAQ